MLDYQTAISIINNMRSGNQSFHTNLYLSAKQLEAFILSNSCEVCGDEKLILIWRRDEACCRIYFFAASAKELLRIKDILNCKEALPQMIDLSGRCKDAEKLADIIEQMGFTTYIKFGRWINNTKGLILKEDRTVDFVKLADREDVEQISSLLEKTFDPLAYEFPSKEAVTSYIENKEVYAAYLNNRLAGFFIFQALGKYAKVIDWTIVKEEYRGAGIGKALYQYALQKETFKTNYSFYADITNQASIHNIETFGFKKDNFTKIIMKGI